MYIYLAGRKGCQKNGAAWRHWEWCRFSSVELTAGCIFAVAAALAVGVSSSALPLPLHLPLRLASRLIALLSPPRSPSKRTSKPNTCRNEPSRTVCNEGIEVPVSADRSLPAARPCDSSQRPSAVMCAAALPRLLTLSFPTPLPQPEKSGFMS